MSAKLIKKPDNDILPGSDGLAKAGCPKTNGGLTLFLIHPVSMSVRTDRMPGIVGPGL